MADPRHLAEPPPYPGAPRWVKVSGIIGGVLVLLVVILILAGGPGRHMPSGDARGQTPPSSVNEEPASSGGGLGGRTPPEGGR